MGHWFDDRCKLLAAEDTISRRGLLRGLMASLALSGVPTSAEALAQSAVGAQPVRALPQQPVALPPGTCTRSTTAGNTVAKVSVIQGDITYTRQVSYDATTKTGTTSITISRLQNLILQSSATTSAAARNRSALSIQYGAEVKGIRAATFTTQDGQSFQGTIDGRAFTTLANPKSMGDMTFADHAPPPTIALDPTLGPVVTALAAQASKSFATCQDVSSALPKPTPRLSLRETGQGGSPGEGWYEPGETYGSPNCDNCWDSCGKTALDYSGLTSWETYICAPCLAAAVFAYNGIWLVCWGACQLPGGGCCPVPCGGAFTCCGTNDHCFRSDLCCPSSMIVCNNVCCGTGVTTCAPDGFCGCPTGQSVCGDNCCAANTTCCGTQCCPAGTTTCCGNVCCDKSANTCCGTQCCPAGAPCLNGKTCCASPSHVCPGSSTCCPPFNVCCGSTCCGANEVCLTDSRTGSPLGCCPASQTCGVGGQNPICCPTGQMCTDQHNSICGACPTGQVSCKSEGNGAVVCCASGANCCNGVCCKPQEVCCTNITGGPAVYGCHLESLCIS
jgi:hypothetical protein